MPPSGIIHMASIQRHKYLVISNLPLQGVSIISCISLYKTQPTAYMTHQLMKDDFPAEWLPIRRTTIFFRGASRLRLNCSAILIKPERWIKKQTVENKGSFQVEFCSINLLWKNYGLLTLFILTPWCRVLLEKLTGLQLVKKFPAFHGTRRFITAPTSVCHLSLSWAHPIQSIYPHPTSWRSILILSTHLCLGLPSGLCYKT